MKDRIDERRDGTDILASDSFSFLHLTSLLAKIDCRHCTLSLRLFSIEC